MPLLLRIALTAWMTASWVQTAGADSGVAFVNLTASPAEVASLRARAAEAGHRALPPGPLRDALEQSDAGAGHLDRASEALAAAKDAYTRFAFEEATERLDLALTEILDAPAGPERPALLARHHFLRGLVREGRGDLDGARASFRMVVRLEPRRTTIDSGLYRPDLVALFEEAAAAERRARASRFEIRSDPPGALVTVNGRRLGRTPLEASLTTGDHYLAVSRPSYRERLERVEVRAGGAYETRLEPLPAAARARELRLRIARARSQIARRRAAGALAEMLGVERLVLVRRAASGGLEASIFRAGDGARFGRWRRAPSDRFLVALEGPPPGASRAELTSGSSGTGSARPWYKRWWGIGLLAGGTAAVVGVAVLALDGGGSSYQVSDFCFEGACP